MASLLDLRRQVDILDRQMVELLSRRTVLVKQIIRILDEEEDKGREIQVLSNWLEHAFDHDLDEAGVEKICKAVMELARRSREV